MCWTTLTVLFPWQHFQITKYIKKKRVKKTDICSGKDTRHLPEDLWLWDGRPSKTDTDSQTVLELHLEAVVGTPGPGSAPGGDHMWLFIFFEGLEGKKITSWINHVLIYWAWRPWKYQFDKKVQPWLPLLEGFWSFQPHLLAFIRGRRYISWGDWRVT